MLEIYAWLTRRYDDSHHMRESARGWVAFGGGLAILAAGPLLIALALSSGRADNYYMTIFPVVPPWAALLAYAALVVGVYALMFGVVLSRAAKWARRCYHF
ncbi:hypothetical protein [Hydrogenophaga pseudoflava]|uniref:Uncharacterized protein n=1 Tax=Hydrogenophaga pseudoflava TaxID=47421 RepID=A0A4P6X3L5_HYDPS|nr:hypothetical protein [Hydrogenophaga pseudoflava]QBM28371.1 hypothetical protein HPF_11780 [Hydrogenophaga pseudoflava]